MRHRIIGRNLLVAAGGLILALCLSAQGALLVPGGAFVTPPEPDPAGGIFLPGSGAAIAFAAGGPTGFTGTLTADVIQDDPSNPFAGIGDPNPLHHGLTFVYTLKNNATSNTA